MTIRMISVLLIASLASGCSADERFTLKESGATFCLPSTNRIGTPPWVDDVVPERTGFAFSGCYEAGAKSPQCAGKEWLFSGVVGEPSELPDWSFKNSGGWYYQEAWKEKSSEVRHAGGRVVVVTKGDLYLIWEKRGSTPPIPLQDGDVLLATCQKWRDGPNFACSRFAKGDGYTIDYTAVIGSPETADFISLDAGAIEFVETLRCNK